MEQVDPVVVVERPEMLAMASQAVREVPAALVEPAVLVAVSYL